MIEYCVSIYKLTFIFLLKKKGEIFGHKKITTRMRRKEEWPLLLK